MNICAIFFLHFHHLLKTLSEREGLTILTNTDHADNVGGEGGQVNADNTDKGGLVACANSYSLWEGQSSQPQSNLSSWKKTPTVKKKFWPPLNLVSKKPWQS